MTKHAATSSKGSGDSASCQPSFHIVNHGDIHISNHNCCTSPLPSHPSHSAPDAGVPIGPGQCVPVMLGSRPKRPQAAKLKALRKTTRIPSAIAGGFVHVVRRALAGVPPAAPWEARLFEMLRAQRPATRDLLRCSVAAFDALSARDRAQIYGVTGDAASSLRETPDSILQSIVDELKARVTESSFGPGDTTEQPGRDRFFAPGDETFDSQVRVWTVNGLRTSEYRPTLPPEAYLPTEIQQHCVARLVNEANPAEGGTLDCTPVTENCPGNTLSDGTCVRVQNVTAGTSVVLVGVNFASIDTRVRLSATAPGTTVRTLDAFIVGDRETPVTEVVTGATVLIRDSRVSDRLSFDVPADLPTGLYQVQVEVPNVSAFPALGDPIVSTAQYLRIVPPPSARFEIAVQNLVARDVTDYEWGSDEIAITTLAIPFTLDAAGNLTPGEEQKLSRREGDVDSQETRDISGTVFRTSGSESFVVVGIIGYEVDSESAYTESITDWKEAFLEYAAAIVAALGAALLTPQGRELIVGHPLATLIGTGIAFAAAAAVAFWAPVDVVISDSVSLSTLDLAMLTGASDPAPPDYEYTMGSIRVKVASLAKSATQYREVRSYIEGDFASYYSLTFRYTRSA